MISIKTWRLKIVKFFVVKSYPYTFRATGSQEVFDSFGSNFDSNAEIAFNELVEDKILLRLVSNEKEFFVLDFIHKMDEIRYLVRTEAYEERAELIQPDKKEFEGLKQEFHSASKRGWPNKGIYYYCTKKDNRNSWVVLIKTKPNVKPYKIILHSLKDPISKISRIWKACVKVYKKNKFQPFFRKQVEDEDQQACGNNRLDSKAAFDIFVHKKWLKIVGRKGRSDLFMIPKLKLNILESRIN